MTKTVIHTDNAPAAIGTHFGEHPQQAGPAVDERVDPTDPDPGVVDRGEPPLPGQERGQQAGELGGE